MKWTPDSTEFWAAKQAHKIQNFVHIEEGDFFPFRINVNLKKINIWGGKK